MTKSLIDAKMEMAEMNALVLNRTQVRASSCISQSVLYSPHRGA